MSCGDSQLRPQCTPSHHVGHSLRGPQLHPDIPGAVGGLLHRDVSGRQADPGREGPAGQPDQPAVPVPAEPPLLLPRRHHLRHPPGPAAPAAAYQDPPAGHLLPGVVPHVLHSATQPRGQAQPQPGPGPGPGLDETP